MTVGLPYGFLLKHKTCHRISLVAPGGRHTLMLTDTGEVFTCGSNDFGQLGREGSQTRLEQVMLKIISNAI